MIITEIRNKFEQLYGKTIDQLKEGNPQLGDYSDVAIINISYNLLTDEILRRNKAFVAAEMAEVQKESFDKALVYQIHYMLTQGDFSELSGYDLSGGSIIDTKELAKRVVCPRTKTILLNAGLFYRGVGGWHLLRAFKR